MGTAVETPPRSASLSADPARRWYQEAVIYQLHVRAFCDADGDGIGDFRGLCSKLDYLQELGVTALWLLPFYPSPLRDAGYDIADYTGVHPDYGTLEDFRRFLDEAHRRDLRVITELVLNHTSDAHPWFQRARRAAPGSDEREFYVWSDTTDRFTDARIIFKDFEGSNWSWDPVARAYYWHRFYAHQPDLNFDHPPVREAVTQAMDFWFDMGVDGMRLDAVPYLFERDGTNCENLPETHAFLKELRDHIDDRFDDRMLLAEANQWAEDAAAYFGDGDECHMAFHFPLMPRLFMALRMEDRFPVLDILEQTPPIPDSCQWAVFLRNHDELTLEMVTDEERDYMYRVYAYQQRARINLGIRRRLAPLLGNHRKRIELMHALLLSMPGTPVLYYGDEIGMGDNIYLGDRDGVRTPMQWNPDRNAGFSDTNPQQLYLPVIVDPEHHYEVVNVEAQQQNPHSLLWWIRRLLGMRKRHPAFTTTSIEFLLPDNHKVLAFIRSHPDEDILVVANLSRFVQWVGLDLSSFAGYVPLETAGRSRLPPITEKPYVLTLGPHDFFWLELVPSENLERASLPVEAPVLSFEGDDWRGLLDGDGLERLAEALPAALQGRRWFAGKARTVQRAAITDVVPLYSDPGATETLIALLRVDYLDGEPDTYLLPLGYAPPDRIPAEAEAAAVVRLRGPRGEAAGVLYDALRDADDCRGLLDAMKRRARADGHSGTVIGSLTPAFDALVAETDDLEPEIADVEQSNTSVAFGERLIFKLFRRVEEGVNPELEIGRFLAERGDGEVRVPRLAGALEYRAGRGEPTTLAVLQERVPHQGDAWSHTLDVLGRYLERMLALRKRDGGGAPQPHSGGLLDLAAEGAPGEAYDAIGPYLDAAGQLGRRTAELHLALAAPGEDPSFAPESFSRLYQRSLYQSMRNTAGRTFRLLSREEAQLPDVTRPLARQVLQSRERVIERLGPLRAGQLGGKRIRCHGDFHLGQVLYTGDDFVIIDFEGEPARPLSERRLKRSPLRDAAGMVRSFHYAAYTALFRQWDEGLVSSADRADSEAWVQFWARWVAAAFLDAHLTPLQQANLLPTTRADRQLLLELFLLDKALYEVAYELNNRPVWARIPLRGVLETLTPTGDSGPAPAQHRDHSLPLPPSRDHD